MLDYLKSLYYFFLDLFFPIFCFSCNKEEGYLCKNCSSKLPILEEQCCPVCEKINFRGNICLACRNKTNLDGLVACMTYEENGVAGKLIKQLKYGFSTEIVNILGEVLVQQFSKYFDKDAVFIPVPLHKSRLNWRGFNQALLLAQYLGKKLNIEVEDVLIKTRNTKDQASLAFEKRKINVENVFKVKRDLRFLNKTMILVDDVVTTSSTLNECAKVLKQSGVGVVWGFTVGR